MELNIAVVDDLENDRKRIEVYIDRYFSDRRNRSVRIWHYSNAEDFLKSYRKNDYHILFLDICMGDMNGLELAERIRSCDNNIRIIFMSTSQEFVFAAFSVHPEGYLCKPYEYDAFTDLMTKTIGGMSEKEKYLTIQFPRSKQETTNVNDIMSVVSNNHSVNVNLITGEIWESNMLFSEFQTMLQNEPGFLECNRGIIINMNYAVQIKNDTFIMQDGTIYPIRRRGRKDISAKFTKYLADKMRRSLNI